MMGVEKWSNRDRKKTSKRSLKNLGKPFRKSLLKDSKEYREWSKNQKKIRRFQDQEPEDVY